jgi:hypothetical protein
MSSFPAQFCISTSTTQADSQHRTASSAQKAIIRVQGVAEGGGRGAVGRANGEIGCVFN